MYSLDAIPTARGYALAWKFAADRKPPVITEWNWRAMAAQGPGARAKILSGGLRHELATRAIPEMYQFQ